MATRSTIIRAVLDELNVVSSGQDVAAEDDEAAGMRVGWALADLAGRMLIPPTIWPSDPASDADVIAPEDESLMPALIRYLAQEVATAFGKEADPSVKLQSEQIFRTHKGIGKQAATRLTFEPALARSFRG